MRLKLSALLILLFSAQFVRAQEIKNQLVFSKVQKKMSVELFVRNSDPWYPIHLTYNVNLTGTASFSAPLPVKVVVQPGQKISLGTVSYKPGPGRSGYQTDSTYNFGDPDAQPDPQAVYLFPYGHGVKHGVMQGYHGHVTHQNCDCLDFDLAENSPICAARDGRVVFVKQDSNIGGFSPAFIKDANFINILHADGTWANYAHLRLHGALVKPGQKVKAGQLIGYSGHTGEAQGPHLHFEVDKAYWDGPGAAIPTLFLLQNGQAVTAEEGQYYYSYHPGEKPFQEVHAGDYSEESLDNYSVDTPLNGAVTLRTYKLDSKTLVYGLNGTSKEKTLTISFPRMTNLTASKPLPYTKVIPPGKEVYLLSLQRASSEAGYSYSSSYSYR